MKYTLWRAGILVGALMAAGCTVGEGEGYVLSDRLYIEDCWNGPFDLNPDFFAAIPYQEEFLMMRVQRGDNVVEQSDGVTVLVTDLQDLRQRMNQPITVGLPRGVTPPGVPLQANADPPKVSLSIFLHNSCHAQNATIYAMSGTITFASLFSGNVNEASAGARLTSASFDAYFADPRSLGSDPAANEAVTSHVRGQFEFYFQRGQPAQPFQ